MATYTLRFSNGGSLNYGFGILHGYICHGIRLKRKKYGYKVSISASGGMVKIYFANRADADAYIQAIYKLYEYCDSVTFTGNMYLNYRELKHVVKSNRKKEKL